MKRTTAAQPRDSRGRYQQHGLHTLRKAVVDSVDAYVLTMPSGPVNRQKRCLYAGVRERQGLADALARYMGMLGLERRVKNLDLAVELAALHRTESPPPSPADGRDATPVPKAADGGSEPSR